MFVTSCQFLVPCGPYLPNALYSNGSTRNSSSHDHLLYDGEGRPVRLFDPLAPRVRKVSNHLAVFRGSCICYHGW
jgi:hypothetical protein